MYKHHQACVRSRSFGTLALRTLAITILGVSMTGSAGQAASDSAGDGVSAADLAQADTPSGEEMTREQWEEIMALAQPGPEHAVLESMAGTWNQRVLFWMTPDSDPATAEATSRHQMILGGRFLQIEAEGDAGGVPMESMVVMGFDRRRGMYTTVGFDTWGTYYVTAEGEYDSAARRLTMSGRDQDPQLGSQEYRFETRFTGPDSFVHTLFMRLPGAEEFRMMESTYTRSR